MSEATETYFNVAFENEALAVAHVTGQGFPPSRIERGEDGSSVLVFAPLPDDRMFGLAKALPIHLSSKLGIVGGPPFE